MNIEERSGIRNRAGLAAAAAALLVLSACSGGSEPKRDGLDLGAPDPTAAAATAIDPADRELRFAVIGDFGTGESDQYAVAESMCAWREENPFRLVFTTGDNVYHEGDPDDFESKFFEPMDCLLSDGVRFRASLGNHDIITDNGRPELEEPAFGMPARNYVVRRAGVRFVVANSNDFRMRWLREALEPQSEDRWTVAVFHHPVFSAGTKHGSTPGLSEKLHGLFVDKGVDLVLTGHDHVYSVSERKRGIRYVVTGGGGARSYGCKDSPDIEMCTPRLHFLYVHTTDEAIDVRAISETGEVFDRFRVRGS